MYVYTHPRDNTCDNSESSTEMCALIYAVVSLCSRNCVIVRTNESHHALFSIVHNGISIRCCILWATLWWSLKSTRARFCLWPVRFSLPQCNCSMAAFASRTRKKCACRAMIEVIKYARRNRPSRHRKTLNFCYSSLVILTHIRIGIGSDADDRGTVVKAAVTA